MGVKSEPNEHELALFDRAKEYIAKIRDIEWIEMMAICNSLSMYATHEDSDIDLFIVTKPGMLWFIRFFVTLRFWRLGVWRKWEDIAGNFCLSFFITTDAMDLSKIAIKNDIYLSYWIYSLKPIINRNNTYEKFIEVNSWVAVDEEQIKKNLIFVIPQWNGGIPFAWIYEKKLSKSQKIILKGMLTAWQKLINFLIRFFLRRKTLKQYHTLWKPEGVIITDDMLKFHDQDRREEIRDAILTKNFDK